jgi:hypothetical protein
MSSIKTRGAAFRGPIPLAVPAVQRSSGPAVQRSSGPMDTGPVSSVLCPVSSVQRSKPGRKPRRLPHPLSPSIPRRCGSRRPPRLTPKMRSPVPAEFPYHSRRGRQRRSEKLRTSPDFSPAPANQAAPVPDNTTRLRANQAPRASSRRFVTDARQRNGSRLPPACA